jgi:hypothetical protein
LTTFVKPLDSLTITLGGGVDTLNLLASTITGNFTIAGSGADDIVNVPSNVTLSAGATTPGAAAITAVQNINFTGGNLTAVTSATLSASAITTSTAANDVTAVSLVATAATGIDLDTTVTNVTASVSAPGNIRLDEVDAITLTSVTTNDGSITVNAGGTVTATNVLSSTDATNVIAITTTVGNILVDSLTASGDTITLNAAGSIEEVGAGDPSADVSASVVNLTAVNGIGATATIEIDTNTVVNRGLTAAVTGTGVIDLFDVDGMRVRSATTADGNITLVAATGVMAVETITAGGACRNI